MSSPALAATIYVDNTLQSDCSGDTYSIDAHACSGHDGAAYRTIQSAVMAMSSGDTVLLRGGTYHETHIDLTYNRHGTETTYNKLASAPGEWAVIDGQYQTPDYFRPSILWGTGGDGMSYWMFERLEITGGGSPTSPPAGGAGIEIEGCDHCQFRYLYIHDNYGDQNDPGFTAGIMLHAPRNCVVEYSHFKGNGNPIEDRNTGNAQLGFTSDYAYGSPIDPATSMHGNTVRYNLFDGQGTIGSSVIGFMHKGFQRFTGYNHGENRDPGDASPNDASLRDYGDRIHHNIFVNVAAGIRVDQDYVQVYNNIIALRREEDFGSFAIETSDGVGGERRGSFWASVYNNTVDVAGADGILFCLNAPADNHPYDCQVSGPTLDYGYGFAPSNIIVNATHGYDSAYLSFEMTGNLNCQDPSPLVLGNFDVSRNLFYKSTDSETVVRFSNVEYTPVQLPSTDAADLVWNIGSGTVFQGDSGAARYKTNGSFNLDSTHTIANGGRGGTHPYLSIALPSYVGATNPESNDWVDHVLGFSDVNTLAAGTSEDAPWVEAGSMTTPSCPDGQCETRDTQTSGASSCGTANLGELDVGLLLMLAFAVRRLRLVRRSQTQNVDQQ